MKRTVEGSNVRILIIWIIIMKSNKSVHFACSTKKNPPVESADWFTIPGLVCLLSCSCPILLSLGSRCCRPEGSGGWAHVPSLPARIKSIRNIHLINKQTENSFVHKKLAFRFCQEIASAERRGSCFFLSNLRQTEDWRFVRRFSFVLSPAGRHKRNRRPRSHFSV